MRKFIACLYLVTILSCSAGQQEEQKICSNRSNSTYKAQLCLRSNNCLNLLPNSTCQVELNYYSTYPNTAGPAPARFNQQDSNYYYIFQPFIVNNPPCPLPQNNNQTCLMTIRFNGNGNNSQPFSAKLNSIAFGSESELTTSITISGVSNSKY